MHTMWHNACSPNNRSFDTIEWRSTMLKQLKKTNSSMDPVCGMTVDQRKTELATTLRGQTYYFCAVGCREAFVADPNKYLQSAPKKKKGMWGRYLERLEKATGGKSMNCH